MLSRKTIRFFILLLAVAMGRGLFAATGEDKPKPPPLTLKRLLSAGEIRDLSGKKVSAADLGDRAAVVAFWDSMCASCAEETQPLNALQEKGDPKQLRIVGITVTTPPEEARKFAREHRVKYRLFVADQRLAKVGEVVLLPTVLVFDHNGKLVSRLVGAQPESRLAEAVKAALPAPQPTAPPDEAQRKDR